MTFLQPLQNSPTTTVQRMKPSLTICTCSCSMMSLLQLYLQSPCYVEVWVFLETQRTEQCAFLSPVRCRLITTFSSFFVVLLSVKEDVLNIRCDKTSTPTHRMNCRFRHSVFGAPPMELSQSSAR